jgi:hypothetical protein
VPPPHVLVPPVDVKVLPSADVFEPQLCRLQSQVKTVALHEQPHLFSPEATPEEVHEQLLPVWATESLNCIGLHKCCVHEQPQRSGPDAVPCVSQEQFFVEQLREVDTTS